MCELLAVSSKKPVSIKYSMHEFSQHGGLSHLNRSGWGMSFLQNSDTLLIKEAKPAFNSPWVRFLEENHTQTTCVLGHVRYATEGEPSYENTHPFKREAYGRAHVFAHNGSLKNYATALAMESPRYRPMGATDSEFAFCYLLDKLDPLWQFEKPSIERRLEIIAYVAEEFRELGAANFCYSDGDALFVHADVRRYDDNLEFGPKISPAIHWIERRHLHVDGLSLKSADESDNQTLLFASVPLTDDPWEDMPRGTLLAAKDGAIVGQISLS
ncbi:MAG: class II glutamine amidotransferase [Proteobacteria bacterium]|nr:class II glutamine amidotransferase [Pseudomonadota bacterium]